MHVPVQFYRQVINAYEPSSTLDNRAGDKARSKGTEPYGASLELTDRERGVQKLEIDRI